MSERGKKTGMISQGQLMIPRDETPVLLFKQDAGYPYISLIAETVNFLRAGCCSVQWLLGEQESSRHATKVLDNLQDALTNLQRPGEQFKVKAPVTGNFVRGSVIEITRITISDNPWGRPWSQIGE